MITLTKVEGTLVSFNRELVTAVEEHKSSGAWGEHDHTSVHLPNAKFRVQESYEQVVNMIEENESEL